MGFLPSKAQGGNEKIATKDIDAGGFGSLVYSPLHQISNIYLSEGYRVVYGAESARDKTVKDRLFRNIEDAHSSRQIRENLKWIADRS